MKHYILVIFMMYFVSVTAQNYGHEVKDASPYLSDIKSACESVAQIECDFIMRKKVAMMRDVNISKGEFLYCREQKKMIMDYTEPKGNKVVVEGDKFVITTNGKSATMSSSDNPAMSQLSAMITACMTGNFIMLSERSLTRYYVDDKYFTMVIKPTNKRVQRYMAEIVLRFLLSDKTMAIMRITERNGDYSEYEYLNKQIK